MDLFESGSASLLKQNAPLADRMRPRTLDEYVGQKGIIGSGRLLRRAIEADQLSSLIFYGPPGTGKTTLARIIANTTQASFITINAVLSGVKEIRESIAKAENNFTLYSRRTILFVDEVHRFNKSQQDALLPHVENGVIILIGATTENPYFEVNKALVSRSRIFELSLLDVDDLELVINRVLQDKVRGFGNKKIQIDADAINHLCITANGDARSLLNALELAVETTTPNQDGHLLITSDIAEESIQKRAVLYDKDGDAHYDIISAFIKSIRGSDPDAALFWMAKMLYAGEDPKFILRRMIILATEDIGLADPQALPIVMAAAQAYDYIGMPEGRFPLSEACIYLATAPKSNTTLALFDALRSIEKEAKESAVPNHLKDGSRDGEGFGHGEGYLYPHAYKDHWVAQQYLPASLQGKVFYNPTHEGFEKKIAYDVERRRELQLISMIDNEENPTFLWQGGSNGAWHERTEGQQRDYYGAVRDELFLLAQISKDALVLDVNCGTGLYTFEALRIASIGGVWATTENRKDLQTIEHAIQYMPILEQPTIIESSYDSLKDSISHKEPSIHFSHIIGRNVLGKLVSTSLAQILQDLIDMLESDGKIVFSQYDRMNSTNLSSFIEDSATKEKLFQIESQIQGENSVNNIYDVDTFIEIAESLGIHARLRTKEYEISRRLTLRQVQEALSPKSPLGVLLGAAGDLKSVVEPQLIKSLVSKETNWKQVVHFIIIKK